MTPIQEQTSRRELAALFSIILNHPSMTPMLHDGIYDLLSKAQHKVDPYKSPECIEMYLEAHAALEDRVTVGA